MVKKKPSHATVLLKSDPMPRSSCTRPQRTTRRWNASWRWRRTRPRRGRTSSGTWSARWESLLPTGRMFGRISQIGPNKKWSGRTNLRPNFGRFWTKRIEKGPNFKKNCFPPSVFLKPKFLQNVSMVLLGNRIIFLSGRIFLLNWPKSLHRVGNTGEDGVVTLWDNLYREVL